VTQYRTKQGDVIDAICYRHYGRESAVVDLLNTNPGLADHGSVLPAGVIINLPALAAPTVPSQPVRLWD